MAPGTDFFRHANGGWLAACPIPADRSYWGVDVILEQQNQTVIRGIVAGLDAGADSAPGSVERKIADFYASGMDETAIDAAHAAPLQPELAHLATIVSRADLQAELVRLHVLAMPVLFQIGEMLDFHDSTRVIAVASQGGLGLPNRDYYLRDSPSFAATRAAYIAHVARMFVLLGDSSDRARARARAVMALETRLARGSMPEADQRDPLAIYHPMSLSAASEVAPLVAWRALFEKLGHPEIDSLNIAMPAFFKVLDHEIRATSLDDWQAYLRWHLVNAYAPYLSREFVAEEFRMRSVLTGEKELRPRWQRVLRAEDDALGFAIGQIYVAHEFSPAAKQSAAAMVGKIRDAMRADLATLSWMTPATRIAARRKLDLMELRVGYPDRARDYTGLRVDRGPFLLNVMRAQVFEQTRELAKIGKPVDRSEWTMTPQTVNAYYDPSLNSLNIPAGILQPPYFDVAWPDAVNYGATGAATVGHEMTHGFDDEGARFDGHGNLRQWWAPADLKKFRAATRCLQQQFSAYTVAGGLHLQGQLVAGEAAADLGGLVLAYKAFKSLPSADGGDADQQFFNAFAHGWAGDLRPEQAQLMATTDPHPPVMYRVNATLANFPQFQAAFHIAAPSPMVSPRRCVIW